MGSALAMDKGIAKQIFKMSGVPTPLGTALKKANKDVSLAELGLKLPVVVKPCSGGSSIGVYIVDTEEAYSNTIYDYYDVYSNKPKVKVGDKVVYSIRVYNEGEIDGYADLIVDSLPSGLEFIKESKTAATKIALKYNSHSLRNISK